MASDDEDVDLKKLDSDFYVLHGNFRSLEDKYFKLQKHFVDFRRDVSHDLDLLFRRIEAIEADRAVVPPWDAMGDGDSDAGSDGLPSPPRRASRDRRSPPNFYDVDNDDDDEGLPSTHPLTPESLPLNHKRQRLNGPNEEYFRAWRRDIRRAELRGGGRLLAERRRYNAVRLRNPLQ